MNIEKIKNYNQKMLAFILSLGVILLLVFIVIAIIEAIPDGNYHDNPSGLIAGQNIETLNQQNLRKQIISYETPWLIDTVKSVYVVPVSVKTLKKPEEIVQEVHGTLGLTDQLGSSKIERGYYNRKSFDGRFTNLLLYTPKEEKTISLFNERVIIDQVQAYYFNDDILLVFYVASDDTDKNGIIDLSDLRNLCIYSLHTGFMRKISDGENRLEDYIFLNDSKDLLLEFKLSQYKENQFDNYQSPGKIMKYDFETRQLTDIVPEKVRHGMQKLVEGNQGK